MSVAGGAALASSTCVAPNSAPNVAVGLAPASSPRAGYLLHGAQRGPAALNSAERQSTLAGATASGRTRSVTPAPVFPPQRSLVKSLREARARSEAERRRATLLAGRSRLVEAAEVLLQAVPSLAEVRAESRAADRAAERASTNSPSRASESSVERSFARPAGRGVRRSVELFARRLGRRVRSSTSSRADAARLARRARGADASRDTSRVASEAALSGPALSLSLDDVSTELLSFAVMVSALAALFFV